MWSVIAFALVATATASPESNLQDIPCQGDPRAYVITWEEIPQITCKVDKDNNTILNRLIEVNEEYLQEVQNSTFQDAFKMFKYGKYPKGVRSFCRRRAMLNARSIYLAAAVIKCIVPQEREEFDSVPKVTDSVMDYVCCNRERLDGFINGGGVECLKEHKQTLQACIETAFVKRLEHFKEDEKHSGHTSGDNKCRHVYDLEKCVKTEVDKCPNKSSSSFLTGLVNSIFMPVCNFYKTIMSSQSYDLKINKLHI